MHFGQASYSHCGGVVSSKKAVSSIFRRRSIRKNPTVSEDQVEPYQGSDRRHPGDRNCGVSGGVEERGRGHVPGCDHISGALRGTDGFKQLSPSRLAQTRQGTGATEAKLLSDLVDLVGIEPTTSSMPWKRAASCATGPLGGIQQLLFSPLLPVSSIPSPCQARRANRTICR